MICKNKAYRKEFSLSSGVSKLRLKPDRKWNAHSTFKSSTEMQKTVVRLQPGVSCQAPSQVNQIRAIMIT